MIDIQTKETETLPAKGKNAEARVELVCDMPQRRHGLFGLELPHTLALMAYSTILMFVVPYHEPWADEAQAWLMARDLGFRDLMLHHLRYEGSPGLWHALLWMSIHILHMPFWTLNWISAFIGICGVYALLRWSPLPKILTLILPFTFWIQYQYAIVARNYVLFPLFAFLCAHFYRKGSKGVYGFAIAAGLLANVSLHGLIVAGLLSGIFLFRLWKERTTTVDLWLRAIAVPAAVITLLMLFAYMTARPAADIESPTRVPMFLYLKFPRAMIAIAIDYAIQAFKFALSTSGILGAAVLVVAVRWFFEQKSKLLMLPLIALSGFLGAVYWRGWHAGMLFVLLISLTWMAWPTKWTWGKNWTTIFAALLLIASAEQVAWSAVTMYHDVKLPYTGARQAARFLHALPKGTKIFAAGYHDIAMLPYFENSSIFANYPSYSYWYWNTENGSVAKIRRVYYEKPDYLVIGVADYEVVGRQKSPRFAPGYALEHQFCGELFMRFSAVEPSCYNFYRRTPAADSAPDPFAKPTGHRP